MRINAVVGRALVAGMVVAGCWASQVVVPAPAGAIESGVASVSTASDPLRQLGSLMGERVRVADLVAAAKWGTTSPIDDPARERQVLDKAAERAEAAGADPREARQIFRDQIEASKLVQRGLHRKWRAAPSTVPTERPRLSDLRARIDQIDTGLVRAIVDSRGIRARPTCPADRLVTTARVRTEQRFDALHTTALVRATRSFCG